MEQNSVNWVVDNFFGGTNVPFSSTIEMGVKPNGTIRQDLVWQVGKNLADGEPAFLGIYERPVDGTALNVPQDHVSLVKGLQAYNAQIEPLFGYTLWSHEQNGAHVKVPSQINLPDFRDRRFKVQDRLSAARFSDALILALTLEAQQNSSSQVRLEGVLLEGNPNVENKVLLAPVMAGGEGRRSKTNHGIVYRVIGYPKTHRIYDRGREPILSIVKKNVLSRVLLNAAYNQNMVR